VAEASQVPPTDTRQKHVRGDDHQALDETAEGEVGERAEEYKECIIDSVIAARQRDALWSAGSSEVSKRHEERCQKEAARLTDLLAAFENRELAREIITVEKLEDARQWARCSLEPWARARREERLARRWEKSAELIRVRFRGVPATSSSVACHLQAEAGIIIATDESHPVQFVRGPRRGSTNTITVTEVTVFPNEALQKVWGGSRMVGGRRIVCEEGPGEEEDEEQPDKLATLLPINSYSGDTLQHWVQVWQLLGVDGIYIHEVVLLAVQCYLPDWRRDQVQNWSPGVPRPLRGVWEGTGAGQGQIRIKGEPIPAKDRNTHQLREATCSTRSSTCVDPTQHRLK
jgi:hypothetical protein